ncbi:MAG: hypothetical protein OXD50_09395 [Chloroflexi bacterium]|nr:hypothetical protein [Chloroflexota bacterium]
MSYTETTTATQTYTTVDIEKVVRRFTADMVMIASSTGAITEAEARDYAHDVEALAKAGFLRKVDITLLSCGIEVTAVTYVVNTSAGELTTSRPGGVLWRRVSAPHLRIVLFYTSSYDGDARESMRKHLKVEWVPTSEDTSHFTLKQVAGRDYASNGWGLQRTDFGL